MEHCQAVRCVAEGCWPYRARVLPASLFPSECAQLRPCAARPEARASVESAPAESARLIARLDLRETSSAIRWRSARCRTRQYSSRDGAPCTPRLQLSEFRELDACSRWRL